MPDVTRTRALEIYPGDTIVGRVSLALWPVDSVTGIGGGIDLQATLSDKGKQPIRNLSGYYCWLDLPPASYRITVRPVGKDRSKYLPQEIVQTVPATDLLNPAAEVRLYPAAAYPFEPTATLVRGAVRSLAGPIAGVSIAIVDRPDIETQTGADGRFVFHARPLQATETIVVRFEKENTATTRAISVVEGKSHDLGTIVLPI